MPFAIPIFIEVVKVVSVAILTEVTILALENAKHNNFNKDSIPRGDKITSIDINEDEKIPIYKSLEALWIKFKS